MPEGEILFSVLWSLPHQICCDEMWKRKMWAKTRNNHIVPDEYEYEHLGSVDDDENLAEIYINSIDNPSNLPDAKRAERIANSRESRHQAGPLKHELAIIVNPIDFVLTKLDSNGDVARRVSLNSVGPSQSSRSATPVSIAKNGGHFIHHQACSTSISLQGLNSKHGHTLAPTNSADLSFWQTSVVRDKSMSTTEEAHLLRSTDVRDNALESQDIHPLDISNDCSMQRAKYVATSPLHRKGVKKPKTEDPEILFLLSPTGDDDDDDDNNDDNVDSSDNKGSGLLPEQSSNKFPNRHHVVNQQTSCSFDATASAEHALQVQRPASVRFSISAENLQSQRNRERQLRQKTFNRFNTTSYSVCRRPVSLRSGRDYRQPSEGSTDSTSPVSSALLRPHIACSQQPQNNLKSRINQLRQQYQTPTISLTHPSPDIDITIPYNDGDEPEPSSSVSGNADIESRNSAVQFTIGNETPTQPSTYRSLGASNIRTYTHSGNNLTRTPSIPSRRRTSDSVGSITGAGSAINSTDNIHSFGGRTDIASVSADYMRVSGYLTSFKGVLSRIRRESINRFTASLRNQQADPTPMNTLRSTSPDPRIRMPNPLDGPIIEESGPPGYEELVGVHTEYPRYTEEQQNHSVIHHGMLSLPPKSKARRGLGKGISDAQGGFGIGGPDKSPKSAISYRLGKRKELFEKRRRACDYALAFAMVGIFLMIVESECTAVQLYEKADWVSYTIKSLIVLSTLLLLLLLAIYHALEVQVYFAFLFRKLPSIISIVGLELLICSICPVPGKLFFNWTTVHSDGETVTTTEVPVDVLLSIPMFLRFYLICRVMLLHSRLFTDASSRSIGALNRINFNTKFVLKTLMTLCPGTVLIVFTASFWVISAWILRLCERYHTDNDTIVNAVKHQNYLNSLWMVAITFLSVGYGDIVPNTYCGRAVAVVAGIMGSGTSSLVVAVIARKLELSRAEKHVHNFMMDTQLTKQLKHAAANVLRETWLIYKNRCLVNKISPTKIRHHQRKFLMAIYELRKVKRGQRKLSENSTTVTDMAKQTANIYELAAEAHSWQHSIEERMTNLEEQIHHVQLHLQQMPELLTQTFLNIQVQRHEHLLNVPRLPTTGNSSYEDAHSHQDLLMAGSLNDPPLSTTRLTPPATSPNILTATRDEFGLPKLRRQKAESQASEYSEGGDTQNINFCGNG